ncbi:MAG: hypothetical protein AABX48_02085 [Nanoarchaeota archaeon]
MKRNARAQEEMVGFALIILIVMIILVVFLALALHKPSGGSNVESYQVTNFEQSLLQYTSTCVDSYQPNYLDVTQLIFFCEKEGQCLDGRNACVALNETLSGIMKESWKVGPDSPYKGYEINISSNQGQVLYVLEGNKTNNYEGAVQPLGKSSGEKVELLIYS